MSCVLPSIITIDDGTTVHQVHGHATEGGGLGRREIGEGIGEASYMDGSAKLFVRFQRRSWAVSGEGPASPLLWDLDLSAPTWTVTLPDPDAAYGQSMIVTTLPARPVDSWDRRTARVRWTLELREA